MMQVIMAPHHSHRRKREHILLMGSVAIVSMLLLACSVFSYVYRGMSAQKDGSLIGTDDSAAFEETENTLASDGWTHVEFKPETHHTVALEYPSGWSFTCCTKAPTATISTAYPKGEFENVPHISVYDFVMMRCEGEKERCGTTPDAYYQELKKSLSTEGQFKLVESRAASSLLMDRFEALETGDVFYIMNTKEGVVGVMFARVAFIGEEMIERFIQRISRRGS